MTRDNEEDDVEAMDAHEEQEKLVDAEENRGEATSPPKTDRMPPTTPGTAPRPPYGGYYPPHMYGGPPPPPPGEGGYSRGYDGPSGGPPPPYGYPGYPPSPYMHPPHYGGYGPPPPYQQHPMYGPPPPYYNPYGPPPSGGEQHPHDPYAGGPHHQWQQQPPHHAMHQDRKAPPPSMRQSHSVDHGDGQHDEGDDADDEEDATGVSARLKTYIKPKQTSTQEVLDRRSRKNQQSRARAAKLRQRIIDIEHKPEEDRTEEEMHIWQQYEQRRQRKNNRSRERAMEKKEEIDRILAKPDKKRTKIEKQFLETALAAKKRKNEGDRLRRQRLKELGLSTKGTGIRPGISARGPLPTQYQHLVGAPPPGSQGHPSHHPHHHPAHHPHPYHHYPGYPPPYGSGSDIPMSPLQQHHPQQHGHSMPPPSPYVGPAGYHSPQRRMMGTPGRSDGGAPPMSYMPPGGGYASQAPVESEASRVEEHHHADGSTTISVQPEAPMETNDNGQHEHGGAVDEEPPKDMEGETNEVVAPMEDEENEVYQAEVV